MKHNNIRVNVVMTVILNDINIISDIFYLYLISISLIYLIQIYKMMFTTALGEWTSERIILIYYSKGPKFNLSQSNNCIV